MGVKQAEVHMSGLCESLQADPSRKARSNIGGDGLSHNDIGRFARDLSDERTERRQLALELQNNVADTQELRGMLDTTNDRLQVISQELSAAINIPAVDKNDRRTSGLAP